MKQRKTLIALAATGLSAAMLAGCSFLPSTSPDEAEPPQQEQTSGSSGAESNKTVTDNDISSNYYTQGNRDPNTSNEGEFVKKGEAIIIENQDPELKDIQAGTLLPYVELSQNLADGEMALDGHKIKLGETSLMELLPELDYAMFNDPSGDSGSGKKLDWQDAEEYITTQRLSGRFPLTCSIIWRPADAQASYRWTNITLWNPADEHLPLGECKIVAVEHVEQFDAANDRSVYAELPGKIDTETKGSNMATFINTYGDVSVLDGYYGFSEAGKSWWTWNAEGRALLGIRVGTGNAASKLTSQGFKYSLPIRSSVNGYSIDNW